VASVLEEAFAQAETAARLAVDRRRENARYARLTDFVKGAWETYRPRRPYVHGWHVDAICEHLQAVTRYEIPKLAITIPPRHGKSSLVSVFWPAWAWTQDPAIQWLFSAYGADLATRDSRRTRWLIESSWYQGRFGHLYALTSDQNVKTNFHNDRGGFRIATGLGGKGTGEGGDFIVCDDPIKTDEADSRAAREKAINAWDQTMSTRANDPERCAHVIICQRTHEQDLVGHVLEQGGWQVLCLPAEYEPNHPFVWPGDPREQVGELLWPERVTEAVLEERKRTLASRGYAGQFQQRPAPAAGSILKRYWWRFYDPDRPPDVFALLQSWDTAGTAKTTSDHVVGQLWGLRGADRYLFRSVRGQWDIPETKRQIQAMSAAAAEFAPLGAVPMTILVEASSTGPQIIAELRSEVAGLVAVRVDGDKVRRAHAVTPQLEAGNVFLPGYALPGKVPGASDFDVDEARSAAWVVSLIHEAGVFPGGQFDDQVDALTMALQRAARVDASVPGGDEFPLGQLGSASGKISDIGYETRF
jgi:predicted phage terminase large subunit-like protein